ncbi:MAG: hypothetical protein ABSD79_02280 [Dehalococcoidales bacterium]
MIQAIETSKTVLSLEYAILVFVAVLGVIQAAAANASLRGLLFAPGTVRIRFWPWGRRWTLTYLHFSYLFAAVTVLPALGFFFVWNSHNATGIIQGSEQAGLFVLSTAAGGIFSLVASSFINQWRLQHNQTQAQGLEALKDITWFQAVWRRWVRRSG